jgi:hypothetical protein
MDYLAGMEPTLSLEGCKELPLATPLTDNVAFNEIESIDSPFSLYGEKDGFLLYVRQTASGPALIFVDNVESVRALMAELGGGMLHLGLNADGVTTGRALLIMPYDEHKRTQAVSYISSGKLKRDASKKPAALAPKPAPVANPAPKPAPAAPAPKPAAKPAPKPEPKGDSKPAPNPGNPFEDGEPGSVKRRGRVPDDGPCRRRG